MNNVPYLTTHDWSRCRDLNPRPFPYHGNALPTELQRQWWAD